MTADAITNEAQTYDVTLQWNDSDFNEFSARVLSGSLEKMTVTTILDQNYFIYKGLSTDAKPMFTGLQFPQNTYCGAMFYETDTGRIYVFNGSSWIQWTDAS